MHDNHSSAMQSATDKKPSYFMVNATPKTPLSFYIIQMGRKSNVKISVVLFLLFPHTWVEIKFGPHMLMFYMLSDCYAIREMFFFWSRATCRQATVPNMHCALFLMPFCTYSIGGGERQQLSTYQGRSRKESVLGTANPVKLFVLPWPCHQIWMYLMTLLCH